MFLVHDFLPTLANLIGAKVPQDRPYDGFDQTDVLLGKTEKSARNNLITLHGDRIAAVRRNQWRIYPMAVNPTTNTNPSFSGYLGKVEKTASYHVFTIQSNILEASASNLTKLKPSYRMLREKIL